MSVFAGKFILQALDLILQGSDDFALFHVKVIRLEVFRDCFFYFSRSECVLESVDGLLVVFTQTAQTSDHYRFCVSSQGILQKTGQFGVPVGHELASFMGFTEQIDASSQSQQASIDIGSFLQPKTSIFSYSRSFTASQVN